MYWVSNCLLEMENSVLMLNLMLVAPVSAADHLGFLESIWLSIHQRPWLMGVYVFAVGLPMILFISFMWPDKRFGPPDQPYYYKKSDDVQPDDPEISLLKKSAKTKGSLNSEDPSGKMTTSTHQRSRSKHS
uniref:Si:ch211-274f20.2 n=1 Tax=Nothobranchius pienaari TaxID=704102 RepID=A0A1A8MGC3_9TELE|nr:calmegin isoform X1 [Nothobranchius furzeri]